MNLACAERAAPDRDTREHYRDFSNRPRYSVSYAAVIAEKLKSARARR
jgi:hypothetical protein